MGVFVEFLGQAPIACPALISTGDISVKSDFSRSQSLKPHGGEIQETNVFWSWSFNFYGYFPCEKEKVKLCDCS